MFVWILRWPRHAAIAAGVALALLAFGAWSTWVIMTANPQPTIDYVAMLNELTREGQPEGEDAWPVYQTMFRDTFGYDPDQRSDHELFESLRQIRRSQLLNGDWDDPKHDEGRTALARLAPVLPKLDQAATYRRFEALVSSHDASSPDFVPGDTSIRNAPLEYNELFSALRDLRKGAMRDAAHRGDFDAVAHHLSMLFRMGDQLALQRPLMNHYVAAACVSSGALELARLLDEFDVPATAAREMLAIVDELEWSANGVALRFIEGERVVLLDYFGSMHCEPTFGARVLSADAVDRVLWGFLSEEIPMETSMFRNVGSVFLPGLADVERDVAHIVALSRRAVAVPIEQIESLDARHAKRFDRGAPMIRKTWNAMIRSIILMRDNESIVHGVRVMLLLEIHHAETGKWPQAIEDVLSVEEFTDPISGEPFHYERTPSDPHGRPYELRIPWENSVTTRREINRPRSPIFQGF